MTSQTPTTDPELSESAREAIKTTFSNLETLTLNADTDNPIRPITADKLADGNAPPNIQSEEYNRYEILVDATGELRLSDVLDEQGELLYFKNNIEILLLGSKTLDGERLLWIELKEGNTP